MRILDAPARVLSPFEAKGARTYIEPAGDPGFYGPDSVAWRAHANPTRLAIRQWPGRREERMRRWQREMQERKGFEAAR